MDVWIGCSGNRLENPRKLTPCGHGKLTPVGHFQLTPSRQLKLTPCKMR